MYPISIVAALALSVAFADEPPAARQIPTEKLKLSFPQKPTGAMQPMSVLSVDEIEMSPLLKGAADELKKAIDFSREKLLVFTWSGSGQDAVAPTGSKTEDGKTVIVFTYTRGLTRDLRQHVRLFAVPRDAGVRVEPGAR